MEVRVGNRPRAFVAVPVVVCFFWIAAGAVEPQSSSGGPVADNSRCYVCHINYKKEELASRHEQANVGCQKCHGESNAHCGDEDNVTPPDVMFPKERINPACLKCHPGEKLSEVHKPVLAGTEPKTKHCTDCHGSHRLSSRVQHWDKTTGQLIPKEEKR